MWIKTAENRNGNYFIDKRWHERINMKEEFVKKLYQTILALETEEECEQFFEDLCSPTELSALKQRFAVAAMLKQDKVYNEILKETGAGTATISRVKRMMNYGSGCMPKVMDRVEALEKTQQPGI